MRQPIRIVLLILVSLSLGLFPADREGIDAVRRGDRLAAERQYTAALDAYQDAAGRWPGSPIPYRRQGTVYVAQGRYGEAWEAYLAATRVGGIDDGTLEGMARLYVAQGSAGLGVGYLDVLVSRRPGRGDLWDLLGQACLEAGRTAQAREAFTRALALEITDLRRQAIHDRLALMCVERDPACALAHLREVERGPDPTMATQAARMAAALRLLEQGEELAFARAKLGEVLFRRGELEMARDQLAEAVRLEPGYVDAHAYLGHVLGVLGEDARAVQHLERAIALDPTYPLPRFFLGMYHVHRGRLVTGRDHLEQAYDLDPTDPAICAAIADTYLRAPEPRYDVAEQWLRVAVDYAPDDVRFHLLLAHLYVDYMIDPTVRGIAVAQVAAQLAPQDSEAQETLGWAYYMAGRYDLALSLLLRARDLAPQQSRIYYRLGEVYRALGQSIQAGRAYQQAVNLDWGGPIGDRAHQALMQITDR